MHAPQLMPEEVADGYWRRLLRLNAVRPSARAEQAFVAQTCQELSLKVNDVDERLRIIASLTVRTSLDVLRAHTIVPVLGSVSASLDGDWASGSLEDCRLRAMAATYDRLLFFCPRCASEDLQFWGFSYWRRSHQVRGVNWCTKHLCPLRKEEPHRSDGVWAAFPDETLNFAEGDGGLATDCAQSNAVQQRYAQLCDGLLDRARPLHRLRVVYALSQQAHLQGALGEKSKRGPSKYQRSDLTEIAAESLPAAWLQQHLGWGVRRYGDGGNGWRDQLGGVFKKLYVAPGAMSYLVFAALLYDSCESALADLDRPLPEADSMMGLIDGYVDMVSRWGAHGESMDLSERRLQMRKAYELALAGQSLTEVARSVGRGVPAVEAFLACCLCSAPIETVQERLSTPVHAGEIEV